MSALEVYTSRTMTKHIFAPWRGGFILGPKAKGCIFCKMAREKKDRANLILHRGEHCFIVFNRYPYTSGHLMIVPYRHIGKLESMKAEVYSEMMALSQSVIRAMKKQFAPRGYNLGMNIGRSAGAGIAGHLHLHIVPRWAGDSNFMATTGDVRVISLSLVDVFDALKQHFPSRG